MSLPPKAKPVYLPVRQMGLAQPLWGGGVTERAPGAVLLGDMFPSPAAAKVFPPALMLQWHEEWSQTLALAFFPDSLAQTSTAASDQPPPILRNQANPRHHLTAGSSTVTGGLGNLWSSIQRKKLRQPRDFLFWRQREGGKEKSRKEKSIYNPVVHPKFLSLCKGGSMPPFQSAQASCSAQAVWAHWRNSSSASACPRSLSFSLMWQQSAYPVQGQCWSLQDVGCYSKTCTLDWVQRAAG